MAYLLRDEGGAVEVVHDRHVMGLFSRAVWLAIIEAAGFTALAASLPGSAEHDPGHMLFLGLKPDAAAGS
jgi:hypothetical protein